MRPLRLAICQLDEASAAGIAARLRGAAVEVCHGPPDGCDAALLAEPGPDLPAAAPRLLAKKMHLLVIANPCPQWGAIEALAEAARRASVQFAVVNPDRYLPSRQLIARQLAAIGEPGLVRLHHWAAAPSDVARALPDPLLRPLDTVLWLVGRPPDRVYAVEQGAGQTGHCLQVHLGFPGGPMALLTCTDRLPAGEAYHSLSVIAARGAAYADDHQNVQLLYRGGRAQALPADERAGLYAAIAQGFVDDLRAERDLSAATASWREVFAAADAVARSLASGQAVTPEGP